VLRDFNSHDQWHDVVDQSRIERGERSDQVGCVRSFSLKNGERIREQLLTLDDREFKSTYCIVESTVPLQRYVATVTLKSVTDGNRTFWHWESSFDTPPGRERELREMVASGVYEAGFANLRQHLARGTDQRPAGALPMPTALPVPARRVVQQRYGGPEVLQAEATEVAAPGPGEVRIRQRAIGVNYFDVYLRKGWIPSMLPLPGTLGQEGVGTVIDVGPGVSAFLTGRSCGLPRSGAGRLLQRALRAGRVGATAAGHGERRRGRRAAAQGA
jgi:NADPH2:quinone reductase